MFAGGFAAFASAIATDHAAVWSSSAWACTCAGVFGTGVPPGLTTTVAFMPGWIVQMSVYFPAFGKL